MIPDLIQYIYRRVLPEIGGQCYTSFKECNNFCKGLLYILRNSGPCAKSFYKYCLFI